MVGRTYSPRNGFISTFSGEQDRPTHRRAGSSHCKRVSAPDEGRVAPLVAVGSGLSRQRRITTHEFTSAGALRPILEDLVGRRDPDVLSQGAGNTPAGASGGT